LNSIDIRPFTFDAARSKAFAGFCRDLYGGVSHWIPPLRKRLLAQFANDFSFYQKPDNRHRHFMVTRGGDILGHVSAFLNTDMRDAEGGPIGCLGFFECVDDYSAGERLFEHAVEWLRQRDGVKRIWGPVNFDIWHGYRLMTRGFDEKPFYGEPHNMPYYPDFFETFGFVARKTWCSLEASGRGILESIIARHEPPYHRMVREGYRFEPLRTNEPGELRALHALVSQSYHGFLGHTPIGFAEFDRLFGAHLRVADPRFLILAYDSRGRPAGFSVAYPDVADAVRAMRGRDDLLGKLRFQRRRNATNRVVYYMIGITPEEVEKRHGLGSAIAYHTVRTILDAGFETAVFALLGSDSAARRLVGENVRAAQREYCLYELGE
jgi:hypothetical protein